jgi:RNA polymerase sigma factor (sigma-70 family)
MTTTTLPHDMQYYAADLKSYSRISKAEIRAIIAAVPASEVQASPPTARAQQAKQRLVEAHLGLSVYVATKLCPMSFQADLLADLIQEANLALLCAVEHYDWSDSGDITNYIFAWMKGYIRRALADRHLIRTTTLLRKQAAANGTLDALYVTMQPVSLDRHLDETDEDDCTFEEAISSVSSSSPLQHDEGKRCQVDELLSYLSPRAQMMLRLYYGLYYEEDERPRGDQEIASTLGVSRNVVCSTLGDAMKRLRAFVRGEASLLRRNGRICISLSMRKLEEQKSRQCFSSHVSSSVCASTERTSKRKTDESIENAYQPI